MVWWFDGPRFELSHEGGSKVNSSLKWIKIEASANVNEHFVIIEKRLKNDNRSLVNKSASYILVQKQ